jgi:hypothetical protein
MTLLRIWPRQVFFMLLCNLWLWPLPTKVEYKGKLLSLPENIRLARKTHQWPVLKNVTVIRMIIICGAPSCGTTYDRHLTIRVVIYAPRVVNDAPRVINCAPREHL